MIVTRILSILTAALLITPLTVSAAISDRDKKEEVPKETYHFVETPAPLPVTFTDIGGHWAENAIRRFTGLGIFIGDESGLFRPEDPMTRGEMAVILQRLLRYKTQSENRFADLTEDWYIEAIQSLRAAGVMRGDENNCALPNAPITREEAVTLFARAFLIEEADLALPYPDAAKISDFARGYVASMTERQFLSGSDGGNFFPADPMTRAEAATLLDKMITACFHHEGAYDYRPFEGLANFVIVGSDNIDILNFDIGGDLILSEGVDYESIRLKMVNHYGRIMHYTPEGYVRHLKAASYIVPIDPTLPLCRHDSSRFQKDDRGLIYYNDPQVESWFGIDVSSWQGEIDWKKVKEEGVYFAFIRAGYRGYESGALNKDTYFEQNIKGALEAGIKVGVYFFSQAISAEEAKEEARFVLEQIKGYNVTFPVVFDWETVSSSTARTNDVESDTLTAATLAFCREISAAGYQPMVYSNQSLSLLNHQLDKLQEYPFWYAEYKDQPTFYYDFDIWQYGATGKLNGIPDAYVDVNISFVDFSRKN